MGSVPGWVGLMPDDFVDLVVRVKVVGPRSSDCVDLIMQDIGTLTHLTGHGDTLSGARVVEVRR